MTTLQKTEQNKTKPTKKPNQTRKRKENKTVRKRERERERGGGGVNAGLRWDDYNRISFNLLYDNERH